MQPNNNPIVTGAPAPQPPPAPIHGSPTNAAVDPGLANLTKTGAVFSDIGNSNEPSNPIAGTVAAQSSVIHDQSSIDKSLDGVLQQVTSNIKAAPPVPPRVPKKGLGFFGKNKPQKAPTPAPRHPAQRSPMANPIHQTVAKPKKPILPITIAIAAAILLCVAAIKAN